MNTSWGFIWQRKDKSQHAVPANWGSASIESACRIQFDIMAGIAGLPYFDNFLYSQKLPFLNSSFVTICSSCTLGIGRWRKSDIDCVWFVMNFRRSRHVVGRSLPVTDWAAGQRLPFRFNLFELSWWKSVHIIYFMIRWFGGPNIQVSQNVVKSALEVLWI
jgi:hypothetical protein